MNIEAVSEFQGRVLVVDDDPIIRDLLVSSLESVGFVTKAAANLTELKEALKQRYFDAILLDLFLDGEDGFEVLPFIIREFPYTKVIIMSAHGTIELAVNAMENGASTFISKSKNPQDIVRELIARLKTEDGETGPKEGGPAMTGQHGIIGSSAAMGNVMSRIELIKDVDSTVLITGESGTGKELVARGIHNSSKRGCQRFEAINCGAIPANLLESELFGHKRGAFTDAKVDRKGVFEVCSGGSLLLDEIGEVPLELQVKLLRVLQEGEVTPLGSNKSIKVNTRVVAATNRNLEDEIRKGTFREDLYFRLAVLTINLPPLRERRTDIPLLINYFANKISTKFNKPMNPISKEVESRLVAYDWAGNIRELQNAIERGVVLSSDGNFHLEDMLLTNRSSQFRNSQADALSVDLLNKTLSEAKLEFEREYLKQLLESTRGNISEASRISGRYRADVYRLLAKHEVEWEEFRH